jgi:methyl-accepting chemotaxis protein
MATFTDEFTKMRQDFDEAQDSRHQLLEDTRQQVQQMAQGVKEQLAGFRGELEHMREEIAEAANRTRTELKELGADLHTGGDIFRKQSMPRKHSHK